MGDTESSPRILSVSWGRIEVEDHPPFKDAKLYPGGAREWDWNETGTEHDPGTQPADIEELLENGAEEIVLSQGMWKRLQVSPETLKLLEDLGLPVHVLPTDEAVECYNELRETKPVGGVFHSTC